MLGERCKRSGGCSEVILNRVVPSPWSTISVVGCFSKEDGAGADADDDEERSFSPPSLPRRLFGVAPPRPSISSTTPTVDEIDGIGNTKRPKKRMKTNAPTPPRFPPLRAPLVRVVLLAVVLVVVVVVVVIVRVVVVVLSVLRVVVGVVISDERYLTSAASSMGSFFIGRLNPTRKVQEEKRSLLGTGSRACVHKRRGQRRRGQRRGQRRALVVVVVVVLCSSLLTSFF